MVARCKFLVPSLYNVNDAAHGIRASAIHVDATSLKPISLLGLFNCSKLANLSLNFITTTSEQHPKTTRRKNWALVMMLKALPLAYLSSALLLELC